MKKLVWMSLLLGLSAHLSAETNERLNSVEAENECRKQIESVYAEDIQIKFKARPTSSFGAGVYTFWINATEFSDSGRKSRGYLCEIKRSGELVQLMQREGRWRA